MSDERLTGGEDLREPHPSMYEMEREDFVALVRYHGANEVIDAVLAVAVEVYGDAATAVERCHKTFLLRAEAMSERPDPEPCCPLAERCHREGYCVTAEVNDLMGEGGSHA